MYRYFAVFFCLLFRMNLWAVPHYYCTAANERYYVGLVNLIGSIHRYDFEQLEEIAVFDLGLTQEQRKQIQKIAKVQVYKIRDENPNLLRFFQIPTKQTLLGWQAWKPVAIAQTLENFPYVLWLDAGVTLQKPLDGLFSYIEKQGYFLSLIGDSYSVGADGISYANHSVGWGSTRFVIEKFGLNQPDKSWILTKESVMSGFVGVSQKNRDLFLDDWAALAQDIRNFADDGTAPGGWGDARHDQTLLSILAYERDLHIFAMDKTQEVPMNFDLGSQIEPFYMTWDKGYLCDKTHVLIRCGAMDQYKINSQSIIWR